MFQSTHPRRVWLVIIFSRFMFYSFNPHTHAGCDFWRTSSSELIPVSIHTPTQGVTCYAIRWTPARCVSIHTPTQGVTHLCASVQKTQKFQSTHPRRVWLFTSLLACPQGKFQSTHPRRVWPSYEGKLSVYQVSIHTPTQGVTVQLQFLLDSLGFQSTHPRRVWRRLGISSKKDVLVSIHTPTQGVTNTKLRICVNAKFQSTHPRRVWLYI